jgi:ribonuclease III
MRARGPCGSRQLLKETVVQRTKQPARSAHSLPTRAELEARLGITFRNRALLETALTHRSLLKEVRPRGGWHYERMEFLGDKVLGLAVGLYLYQQNPEAQEGSLSSFHSSLVNNEMLYEVAEGLGLEGYVRVGKGLREENALKNGARRYILACVFEALIGAIYLDRGMGTVELFLREVLYPKLDKIRRLGLHIDPKVILQKISQAAFGTAPYYRLVNKDHPDSDDCEVEVCIGDTPLGRGRGSNRKEAEKIAARDALQKEFGEFPTEG